MKWYRIKDYPVPIYGVRVLIYSPAYEKENPMRFRIMDSKFVKLCEDATHYAYLEKPDDE